MNGLATFRLKAGLLRKNSEKYNKEKYTLIKRKQQACRKADLLFFRLCAILIRACFVNSAEIYPVRWQSINRGEVLWDNIMVISITVKYCVSGERGAFCGKFKYD